MKLITVTLIFTLIYATTACFLNLNRTKDNPKPGDDSTNAWDEWKDQTGRPFYINHEIGRAQRENPREIDPEKSHQVTEIPYPQTFEEKQELFHLQIEKSTCVDDYKHGFEFKINRSNILKDSFKEVMRSSGATNMKKMLKVKFKDEICIDTRENIAKEWLTLLSEEISDPQRGYFRNADEDNYESEINPESKSSDFQFIGRIVGTAVFHQILVNVSFVHPYYKTILHQPVTMHDVEVGDPMYYKSLMKMEKDQLVAYLKSILFFPKLSKKSEEDLRMTIVHYKYETSICRHMSAFLKGFADLIPLHLLRIFTADELKLLISGTPTIDVDDWKTNTIYAISEDSDSELVQWFWEIMNEFDNDERRRLLQFVTGTSRVPVGGFKNLDPKFKIELDERHLEGADDRCPTAKVCFNKIILLNYSSKEVMKGRIQMAIRKENQKILLA